MGFPFTIEDEAKLLPLKNARLTGGNKSMQIVHSVAAKELYIFQLIRICGTAVPA